MTITTNRDGIELVLNLSGSEWEANLKELRARARQRNLDGVDPLVGELELRERLDTFLEYLHYDAAQKARLTTAEVA